MDYIDIDSIISERSEHWSDFSNEDREKVYQACIEVLKICKNKGIVFDESAGITFVTHLTTLYYRLFFTHEEVDIDEELSNQIEEKLQFMAKEIAHIIEKIYKKDLPTDEVFLIATHLGAMIERIKEEQNGKSKSCDRS